MKEDVRIFAAITALVATNRAGAIVNLTCGSLVDRAGGSEGEKHLHRTSIRDGVIRRIDARLIVGPPLGAKRWLTSTDSLLQYLPKINFSI